MASRSSRHLGVIVGLIVVVLLAAACGESAPPALPTTLAEPITTTLPPQAVLPTRSAPPPKPTTTVTTTTQVPLPFGFPDDIALPPGEVGFYTGSPEIGFHLNLSTSESFPDLVNFFTDSLSSSRVWELSVRDVGRGFLPGFEGVWAIYTADDHVLSQLQGEYEGVIEIEGRHVNFLLDPLGQPPAGEEPSALPGSEEIPRPSVPIEHAAYSAGKVRMEYGGSPVAFTELLEAYRAARWQELGASERIAVGELAGWKVTVEYRADGTLAVEFEDLSLSYP